MNTARLLVFIALRQLWDRRLLSAIAIAGVALGVAALIALNGLMSGFQSRFKQEILRISPHVVLIDREIGRERSLLAERAHGPVAERVWHQQPTASPARIKRPRELLSALERLPGVRAACPGLAGQVIVSLGNKDVGVDLRGVRPAEQERCTSVVRSIRQGRWSELSRVGDGVVLGVGVARLLGAQVGDVVRVAAPGAQPIGLTVVAVFDTGIPSVDRVRVYTNIASAQAALHRPDAVGRVEIRLADPEQAVAIAARIEQLFGYDAESWQETNANFLGIFEMQKRIVRIVIGTILTLGGFSVLAIQIMIVMQKTREISILRAVGMRRSDILWVFMMQGLAISLLGAALGDLAGWRALEYIATVPVKSEGIIRSSTTLVDKDPVFYGYGLAFALLVGLIASLLPAWRAARVEPVEVLRGQIA